MQDSIDFRKTSLSHADARRLVAALNAELSAMYPEPGATHFGLDEADVASGRGAFVIAYRDGEPVGCGAVRRLDADTAELKRMYVAPTLRGAGLGRQLLAQLEHEARALGATRVILETGTRQLAALALYRGCGFEPIALYGEYRRSPETSVCLGKSIGVDAMETVKFDVDDEPGRRRFLDETSPRRLASLAQDAKPSWGRMSAQQMVEHLTWLYDLSTGLAEVTCPIPQEKREPFKVFLRNPMRSPRDLMNPALTAGLPPLKAKSMAAAVAGCDASRRRFADPTEAVRAGTFVHPLLGPLDHDEWSRFHFKHLFHHLVQFGLIAEA